MATNLLEMVHINPCERTDQPVVIGVHPYHPFNAPSDGTVLRRAIYAGENPQLYRKRISRLFQQSTDPIMVLQEEKTFDNMIDKLTSLGAKNCLVIKTHNTNSTPLYNGNNGGVTEGVLWDEVDSARNRLSSDPNIVLFGGYVSINSLSGEGENHSNGCLTYAADMLQERGCKITYDWKRIYSTD